MYTNGGCPFDRCRKQAKESLVAASLDTMPLMVCLPEDALKTGSTTFKILKERPPGGVGTLSVSLDFDSLKDDPNEKV